MTDLAKSSDKSKHLRQSIPFEQLPAEIRQKFEFLAHPSGDYHSLLEGALNCPFLLHTRTYYKSINGSKKKEHELLLELQNSYELSPSLSEGGSDELEEITAKARKLVSYLTRSMDTSTRSIFANKPKLHVCNEQVIISRFQYMDSGRLAIRLLKVKMSGESFSEKWFSSDRTFSYIISFQSELFLVTEKRMLERQIPVLDFNL